MTPQRSTLRWLSVRDGSQREIKTFEAWRQVQVEPRALSPDGAWVAFSARASQDSDDRHIFLLDFEGKSERPVVTAPGRKSAPIWSPDSKHLLFAIEGGDKAGLWAASLENGNPAGAPSRVAENVTTPLLVTTRGDLFFARPRPAEQLVLVADRTSGRVAHEFPGSRPSWSPDGRSIAFSRARGSSRSLIIRSLRDGAERSFASGRLTDTEDEKVQWLDGGRALFSYIPGSEPNGGTFFRIDLADGKLTPLFERITPRRIPSRTAALSPDGLLAYALIRESASSSWTGIIAIELATGEERTVASIPGSRLPANEPGDECGIAISPDGSTLAVLAWAGEGSAKLLTASVAEGNVREVLSFKTRYYPINLVQWTPDGRHIVFGEAPYDNVWRLVRISPAGGDPQVDGLTGYGLQGVRGDLRGIIPTRFELSPDGLQVALDQWTKPKRELWKLAVW